MLYITYFYITYFYICFQHVFICNIVAGIVADIVASIVAPVPQIRVSSTLLGLFAGKWNTRVLVVSNNMFPKFDQLFQKLNTAGKHRGPDDHVSKLTFFKERKSKEKN
jgi:hypothetical protein